MKKKKNLLAAMLCVFSMTVNSAAVFAQVKDKKQEPKPGAEQQPDANIFTLPAPPNRFAFIQSEYSFGGPAVKGAPYSAEAVTETIQMLGDGNRIIQNSSSRIYRDSEGRTRHEQSLKAIGPWAVSGEAPTMISINDPVSGVNYSLNSNTKTAHKMMGFPAMAIAEARKAKEMRLKTANGAESGASVSGGANSASFGVVTGSSSQTVVNASSSGGSSMNTVTLTRGGPNQVIGAMTQGAPAPGLNGVFSWSTYDEGEVNTESLGKQVIEGVEVVGQRVTVTIQAGKIGNERPIVTVNERWYSPELQTVVFSKNSDPRMGETTYRLTNIDRSEPNSTLFQVPADYTIDEPSFNVSPVPADLNRKIEIEKRVKRPNEN